MAQKLVMTRLGVISCAKVFGILYFIIGLLIAIPLGIIATLSGPVSEGIFIFIGFPILYGAMGAISGIIMAVPYNVIAQKIGGIEYEAEVV